jgi:hypothetical protein
MQITIYNAFPGSVLEVSGTVWHLELGFSVFPAPAGVSNVVFRANATNAVGAVPAVLSESGTYLVGSDASGGVDLRWITQEPYDGSVIWMVAVGMIVAGLPFLMVKWFRRIIAPAGE